MDIKPTILFFDNEGRNWGDEQKQDMKAHESDVRFYLVDDHEPNNMAKSFTSPRIYEELSVNKGYIEAYIEHFANLGNTYALYLKEQLTKGPTQYAKIFKQEGYGRGYPTNGFDEFIPMLEQLPANTENIATNTYILSDWDRTVTAAEGIYFGENMELLEQLKNGNVKLDDVIDFAMGGQERRQRVINLLDHLKAKNIPFIILTHNPAASKSLPSRKVYLDILTKLFNMPRDYIDKEILFTSKDYLDKDLKSFKKNSACHTIVAQFLQECMRNVYGGQRRKVARKTKKRRKNKNKKMRKTRYKAAK